MVTNAYDAIALAIVNRVFNDGVPQAALKLLKNTIAPNCMQISSDEQLLALHKGLELGLCMGGPCENEIDLGENKVYKQPWHEYVLMLRHENKK